MTLLDESDFLLQKSCMAQISLRPANPATDKEFGRSVHHQAYRDVVVSQFGAWDEQLQDRFFEEGWRRAPHKIISYDGVEVGVVSVALKADHIFISEIQILPQYQSLGIGQHILEEQKQFSRESKLPLRLQVLKKNRAIRLYERNGFTRTSETSIHILMEWSHGA